MSTPSPTPRASWALTLALAALIGVQVSRLATGRPDPDASLAMLAQIGESQARGGMVSQAGGPTGFTVMTFEAGNEDILLVLDGRTEQLMAYRMEGLQTTQMVQRLPLARAFTDARVRFQGKPAGGP